MKKNKLLAILLIILVFTPALLYSTSNHHASEYIINLSYIRAKFDKFLYKFHDFDDELPIEESMLVDIEDLKLETIEKPLIKEDIDYLFSLLKYGYSGYEFFGGDEIFHRAKKNIIWTLYEMHGNEIEYNRFLDLIYNELDFIQDSHFTLGHYKLCEYSKYYSSRNMEFLRDLKGYYTKIDRENFYLKSINGKNPESYMKLTLNQDGDLVYNLGILSNTKNISIPLNLSLESEDDFRNNTVNLFEYIPLYKDINQAYRYYEIDNIPILELNSLTRLSQEDFSIEEFLDDSHRLKDKESIIIDLRGNTGGSMINIDKWYKGFTGQDLQRDIGQSGLYTNTSTTLSKAKFQNKKNEQESIKDQCLDQISNYEDRWYFPGWSPVKIKNFIPAENNTNIYILVDKDTASAAEFFAYYLKKLDKVTLIGTNSNGCTLTGNCNTVFLPNSRLRLHISHKLYLNKEFTNTDGLGLLPDLWIKPELSMDRIIKYILKKNKAS